MSKTTHLKRRKTAEPIIWVVDCLDPDLLGDIGGEEGWDMGQNHSAWASAKEAMAVVEHDCKVEIDETFDGLDSDEQKRLKKWKMKWKHHAEANNYTAEGPWGGRTYAVRPLRVQRWKDASK